MGSLLKKLCVVVIFVLIGVFVFSVSKNDKKEQTVNDYEIIETVRAAASRVVETSAISAYDNQAAWYIFDLRAMYQNPNKFQEAMKNELGDDFNTQLSTGDYIFVGVLPYKRSYRVYAGDPNDANNMVYPEWKSTKIPKKQ